MKETEKGAGRGGRQGAGRRNVAKEMRKEGKEEGRERKEGMGGRAWRSRECEDEDEDNM
jgi:hypothetical protein